MRSSTPPGIGAASSSETERRVSAGSPARLLGTRVPSVELSFAEDARLDLAALARERALVICVFGGLGAGKRFAAERLRLIEWTGYAPHLAQAGFRPVAISSETPTQQLRWAGLAPDWVILGDPDLLLARLLALPTLAGPRGWAYEPITLTTRDGEIVAVDYSESFEAVPAVVTQIG